MIWGGSENVEEEVLASGLARIETVPIAEISLGGASR